MEAKIECILKDNLTPHNDKLSDVEKGSKIDDEM